MTQKDYHKELLQCCLELAKISSPPFKEKELSKFLEAVMVDLCFDRVRRTPLGTLMGEVVLSETEGPHVLLVANLDTSSSVVGEETAKPPNLEVSEGKITGDGVAEHKGALAASLFAVRAVKEDLSKDPKGKLTVAAVPLGSFCASLAARELLDEVKPDCVLVAGPTALDVCFGQRGKAKIVVENRGKRELFVNSERGINALKKMLPLLLTIEREFLPRKDPLLGSGCLEIVDVEVAPPEESGFIPDRCSVVFHRRLLPGENKEEVVREVKMIADGVAAFDLELDIDVFIREERITTYTGTEASVEFFEPAWVCKDKKFSSMCLEALTKKGLSPRTLWDCPAVSGGYYAAVGGLPTVVFGPGSMDASNSFGNVLDVEELLVAFEGYKALLEAILKGLD